MKKTKHYRRDNWRAWRAVNLRKYVTVTMIDSGDCGIPFSYEMIVNSLLEIERLRESPVPARTYSSFEDAMRDFG
jgi:hypothetical protein